MRGDKKHRETGKDDFTERAIMALVMQAAELKEAVVQISVVVAALALAKGISIDV